MTDFSIASGEMLLSVPDAARKLNYSTTYIRVLANSGQLPSLRITRGQRLFRPADLEAFRKSHAQRRRRRVSNPQFAST